MNVRLERREIEAVAPKCVIIHAIVAFDWLNAALMAKMRDQFGTRFILIGSGKRQKEFEKWLGANDRFVPAEGIETGESGGPESELERARSYERRLGVSYVRDILQQERGIAVNLLNATPYSPFRQAGQLDLDILVARTNRCLEFFEQLLRKDQVDLVLARTLDAQGAALVEMATNFGIPVTFPRASRVGAGMTWASDAYVGSAWIGEVFESEGDAEPIAEEEIVTPEGPRQQQQRLNSEYSLPAIVRKLARTTFLRADHLLRDLARLRFGKRLSYWSIVASTLNSYRVFRFIRRRSIRDLSQLGGRPVLFFPLSLDPEYTIQSLSKEFSDTKAMVQHVALAMPAGSILAVKEHMQIGNRAVAFYRDILKLPNVVMIDPAIRGIDVVKDAHAVASVNSTATLEAAYFGKRALLFSCHSEFTPLPSVRHVADLYDMPSYLQWVLEPLDVQEKSRIQRDAARFRNALKSTSYEAPGVRYLGGKAESVSEDVVERALDLLLAAYASARRRGSGLAKVSLRT